MEYGRAAVLRRQGDPVELVEYPVPDPEPGAILLKMERAGVCGSDLNIMRGLGPLPDGGRLMGHEGFGSVYKLGSGVTTDSLGRPIKEGDRLMHAGLEPCLRCRECLRGEYAWCPSFAPGRRKAGDHPYFYGTFSDYYYVRPGYFVFKIPDNIADTTLTFINCATGTVAEPMMRLGINPEKTVVVQGAGGLGLNATALLRMLGARRVIVLDRQPHRLELAKEMGADDVINIDEVTEAGDRVALVRELTDGYGADVVMDVVGHPYLLEEAIPMLSNGGTFVQVGLGLPGQTATITPVELLRGKTIMGTIMYRPRVIPMLLDILSRRENLKPLDHIVSKTYSLADVNQALIDMDWMQSQVQPARASVVP